MQADSRCLMPPHAGIYRRNRRRIGWDARAARLVKGVVMEDMLYKYSLLKALRAVLSEPGRKLSVRGLARLAGLSAGSAKNCLDYMKGKGLVKLEKVGRSYQYQADLSNPLCRQWKMLFSLEAIEEARIVGKILEGLRGVSSVVVYGSVATGTDDGKSDLDLLAVASGGKVPLEALGGVGREVNLIVFTPAQWREKALKDKVFHDRVVLDCIVLYGEKPVVL